MNKTILSTQDIKFIFENILKKNSKKVEIIEQPYNESKVVDFYDYFDFEIYSWKNRIVKKESEEYGYEDWVDSLNFSLDRTYGLVEIINDEVVPSADLDISTKSVKVSFLVPVNKIENLENYLLQVRNVYLGKPEEIQNQDGEILTTYINMGVLVYESEPEMTPFGEVINASLGFTISYINNVRNYHNSKIEISLDGDDEYDEEGQIIGETKYLQMPLLKTTWQTVFVSDSAPAQNLPNITGFYAKSVSNTITLSFYDFNQALSDKINRVFYGITAYRINSDLQTKKSVNIPAYLRTTLNGTEYTYKMLITHIEKSISNGENNIMSISLKSWGMLN